jgi:ribosomal protein L11 methyltransferase
VRDAVRSTVRHTDGKQTPGEIQQTLSRTLGVPSAQVRKAIRALVRSGELAYSGLCGTTFLERSFDRPVRVSPRICLCPPGLSDPPSRAETTAVRIQSGAAFGRGDHPSTRLALRGIDFAMKASAGQTVLDIGTGTGVLAIAALLLGAQRALALDIDPCARVEAGENARLNGVSDRMEIGSDPLDRVRRRFSLIVANLRPPTLSRLARNISDLCEPDAMGVFSGFRPEEWKWLQEAFGRHGWTARWRAQENNWAGAVLARIRR